MVKSELGQDLRPWCSTDHFSLRNDVVGIAGVDKQSSALIEECRAETVLKDVDEVELHVRARPVDTVQVLLLTHTWMAEQVHCEPNLLLAVHGRLLQCDPLFRRQSPGAHVKRAGVPVRLGKLVVACKLFEVKIVPGASV